MSLLSCNYPVLRQGLSLRTISYMSGPSKKALLTLFLIGCLKVALQRTSLSKQNRRKTVGISVIIFWHLSLYLSFISHRGWERRGKHTGRSFHILIQGFRALWEMILCCVGIKSCSSDSLVLNFPATEQSCPGLLSRYSEGELRCGSKSCSSTIPFPLVLVCFSNISSMEPMNLKKAFSNRKCLKSVLE